MAVQFLLLGHVGQIDESPGYNAGPAIEEKFKVEPLANAWVELDAHHVVVEDVPCELAVDGNKLMLSGILSTVQTHKTFLQLSSGCVYQYSPVLRVCGEKVGLYKGKGGHRVAQYVCTPHQGDPVVEDDGGRKPVEIVCIGKPQSMSDEPALQPIDLVLVNQTCSNEGGRQLGKFDFTRSALWV